MNVALERRRVLVDPPFALPTAVAGLTLTAISAQTGGVILRNARAMGEFGAMPVVPGHVRGLSNTLPLHAEIRYYEDDFVAAFAVASLLAFLALLTLGAKAFVEWRSPELRGPAPRRAGRYTDRGAEP